MTRWSFLFGLITLQLKEGFLVKTLCIFLVTFVAIISRRQVLDLLSCSKGCIYLAKLTLQRNALFMVRMHSLVNAAEVAIHVCMYYTCM